MKKILDFDNKLECVELFLNLPTLFAQVQPQTALHPNERTTVGLELLRPQGHHSIPAASQSSGI